MIGDYSSFSRLVLADILHTEIDMEVLDTAENGEELIYKISAGKPDLVIADYFLPKNQRMQIFRRIQHEFNIPILMIIGQDQVSEDFILEAMKMGVYDYVKITSFSRYPQFRSLSQEIVDKVRSIMVIKDQQLNGEKLSGSPSAKDVKRSSASAKAPSCLVVIGGSTGATKALETIISGLNQSLSAVVLVAVHLPEKFTRSFTTRIRRLTSLKVLEGRSGLKLERGQIIVAPGNRNMIVSRYMGLKHDWRVAFDPEPADPLDCPSVDVLMKSVARLSGPKTLGVILTGMGRDGTAGSRAIVSKQGQTIAQDEASSTIFGMAKSAIEKGHINKVVSLNQIPDYINKFAAYHQQEGGSHQE